MSSSHYQIWAHPHKIYSQTKQDFRSIPLMMKRCYVQLNVCHIHKEGWSPAYNNENYWNQTSKLFSVWKEINPLHNQIWRKCITKWCFSYLFKSTVVTLNTTPLSQRIMKSLWEKGQFPMLSPSLPACRKKGRKPLVGVDHVCRSVL